MDREALRERLLGIMANGSSGSVKLDMTGVNEETSLLRDLTLDSVQILELVVDIESEFGFSCRADELSSDLFDRFGNLVDYIVTKLAGAHEASA